MNTHFFLKQMPEQLLKKWQFLAEVLSDALDVSTVLILRSNNDAADILVSSRSEQNAYCQGDKIELQGHYCESVIKERKVLKIINARVDSAWNRSKDLKNGMISFWGCPLITSDGVVSGAICILDSKEIQFTPKTDSTLQRFRDLIEYDLKVNFPDPPTEADNPSSDHQALFRTMSPENSTQDAEGKNLSANPAGESIQGISLDQMTSELIAAKKKAEESENRFRLLFENMTSGFALHEMIFDPDGQATDYRFLEVNPAFEYLTGCRASDIAGRSVRDILPDTEQYWIDTYGKVVQTGIPMFFENYAAALGRHYSVAAFRPGKGQFACIFHDITDRKAFECELAREKERLSITLRSIGDGVVTTDKEGSIVLMNKVAEELTGWKSEEAVGRPLSDVLVLISEVTREKSDNPVEKVLSTGRIIELANHTCLIARDGREFIIADSAAPIFDAANSITGVVLVFRDITEKQKMQDALQIASKLESIGVLAGGIAHDFNNLLSGIFGYIEMAVMDSADQHVKEHLNNSLNAIERARGLTQQLLTFAKGGLPVRNTYSLFPFLRQTAEFALSGSHVKCRFIAEDGLWLCHFDKYQIAQVMDNIIINSVQAMPQGGSIEIAARNECISEDDHRVLKAGNYVKISIKDTGCGIPKQHLSRIFDPFFSTKPKGHGLGLATCYSIISKHDGLIEVDSVPGQGATFHIFLPAAPKDVSEVETRTQTNHTGSGTFLIMDDEKLLLDAVGKMIKGFGYTPVLKNNGQDAVDFILSEIEAGRMVKAAIFDLTIPGGMGGREAVENLRNLGVGIPVFVTSGYAENPVIANPAKYGFTSSLCKPFMRAELAEMLNNFL